jgi:hypothetical protein
MGGAARHDEETEGEEHPVKWKVACGSPNKIKERAGDRHVGDADQEIRDRVQPYQRRIPKITVPMGHKPSRRKQEMEQIHAFIYTQFFSVTLILRLQNF